MSDVSTCIPKTSSEEWEETVGSVPCRVHLCHRGSFLPHNDLPHNYPLKASSWGSISDPRFLLPQTPFVNALSWAEHSPDAEEVREGCFWRGCGCAAQGRSPFILCRVGDVSLEHAAAFTTRTGDSARHLPVTFLKCRLEHVPKVLINWNQDVLVTDKWLPLVFPKHTAQLLSIHSQALSLYFIQQQ